MEAGPQTGTWAELAAAWSAGMNARAGTVYLTGAGPGDPELLTRRALHLLQQADVVLHDDLVAEEIVAESRAGAKRVNVGKRCGTKKITQQEIHALMIEHARAGRIVVRLKSGDPLIFGRAGEEIRALTEAGVPFVVIPGVTAAFAAAAASGFSMTDRGGASRLVLESGHHAEERTRVTDDPHHATTLVRYMPGSDYRRTQEGLLAAGWLPETPVLLVSCAGQRRQRIHRTTIALLHATAPLPAPAILLIGRSIAMAPLWDDIPEIAHGQS